MVVQRKSESAALFALQLVPLWNLHNLAPCPASFLRQAWCPPIEWRDKKYCSAPHESDLPARGPEQAHAPVAGCCPSDHRAPKKKKKKPAGKAGTSHKGLTSQQNKGTNRRSTSVLKLPPAEAQTNGTAPGDRGSRAPREPSGSNKNTSLHCPKHSAVQPINSPSTFPSLADRGLARACITTASTFNLSKHGVLYLERSPGVVRSRIPLFPDGQAELPVRDLRFSSPFGAPLNLYGPSPPYA